jgi:hypothetical protein
MSVSLNRFKSMKVTVDSTRVYIESLLGRKIEGEEILIMGIAYIQGIIAERENENKD